MDGHFEHNDFEHFLKQNADAHRLYPSEKAWTRIYSRMHGGSRRRTIALLILLPLLTASGWFLVQHQPINGARTDASRHQALYSTTADTRLSELKRTNESSTIVHPTKELPIDQVLPAMRIDQSLTATPIEQSPPATPIKQSHGAPQAEPLQAASQTEALHGAPQTEPLQAASQSESILATAQPIQPATITEQRLSVEDPLEERNPQSIESVVNSYQRQLHRPRFKWQFFFTPTVSYRSLQEDQKFIAQARMSSTALSTAAAMANSTDLASVIRHRPDIGMQLGFMGTYPISKKIDWVSGFQFNVSKYDIEAYSYPSEVATIALMNPWGGTSTVSTITSFRSNGFRSTANWLRNYYYSVSLPIGLQWRVLGKKQTHWGISATFQPTYVVGNRAYVISVDYQNYAEVPYLINKWNLNVGVETYARFQLGKTDFQIGPQLRYQTSSSFKKGYPVQEHLYDFGIKLGMRLGK